MGDVYRVRIKRGNDEIEVESHDRAFVEDKLKEFGEQRTQPAELAPMESKAPSDHRTSCRESLKEFSTRISHDKKNESAAVIAYYLEHLAETPLQEWRPNDIEMLFADLRKPRPANMRDLILKSNFFMEGHQPGSHRLTETGVKWVEERLGKKQEAA